MRRYDRMLKAIAIANPFNFLTVPASDWHCARSVSSQCLE